MTDSIKQAILDLVAEQDYVSFVQICRLPGATGPYLVEFGTRNVVYWHGLSEEAANAMVELRRDGAIVYEPTSYVTYLVDGGVLDMPLARRADDIERGYREPHWLPVTVRLGPRFSDKPAYARRALEGITIAFARGYPSAPGSSPLSR